MAENETPTESVVDLSEIAEMLGVPTPVWTADDEANFQARLRESEKTGIFVISEREGHPT
ncbi:hypothetical protein [Actinoplanes solisilvae]|uniref:hypothetical protein n=1 Tax=Actinoplanes solisilvae TaxID=2486853 RepID=UPI000FDC354D|nr:hypothetical protein [Actinoplanes solisilvae]